jgi:hypothetical protein
VEAEFPERSSGFRVFGDFGKNLEALVEFPERSISSRFRVLGDFEEDFEEREERSRDL